jgi:UDP-N-acetyl-D-glucosamine dehydrogenase
VICETLRSISKSLSPGKLVVIESTVYPGFTDTVARSILEKSGMKCGVDFGLAHSPSRVDPGNTRHRLVEIPKVLGGVEQDSGEVAALLYESIIKAGVIRVTDTRTAECVKMLENVYRFVNIALVNEFALFCERVGVNVFDAIKAAASKPFGFHPHYPGPGVGGPCIPKDQLYLRYSAHKVRLRLRVVEASAKTNDMMTDEVAEEVQAQMKRFRVTSPKIAVLGLAYKKDRPETVESPAVKVISRLLSKKRGHARLGLALYDPCVSSVVVNGKTLECEKTLEQAAARADCLLFLVDHEAFSDLELPNLKRIVARECVVVDTKNIFEAREVEEVGFRYVGLGKPHRCPNAQSTKRP